MLTHVHLINSKTWQIDRRRKWVKTPCRFTACRCGLFIIQKFCLQPSRIARKAVLQNSYSRMFHRKGRVLNWSTGTFLQATENSRADNFLDLVSKGAYPGTETPDQPLEPGNPSLIVMEQGGCLSPSSRFLETCPGQFGRTLNEHY